jgi:beta-lactam-binding protein with PASTA domain
VVVPDVVGLDVVSAYDAVREAGFAVQVNEPVDVTPNWIADVSRQSPTAGTAGRRRTAIVLSLGLGLTDSFRRAEPGAYRDWSENRSLMRSTRCRRSV